MEAIYQEFGDVGAPSIYQLTVMIYESNNK
jgi:hypothetical protein